MSLLSNRVGKYVNTPLFPMLDLCIWSLDHPDLALLLRVLGASSQVYRVDFNVAALWQALLPPGPYIFRGETF